MSSTPLIITTKVDLSGFDGFKAGAADVNRSTNQMSEGFQRASNSAREAGESMGYSLGEARHAAMGLGEEIGVHLPRTVSAFLAESKVIGPLLAASFSAVAVVGLIQILAQVPDAINKIVAALSGWDDEAKKTFIDQIALNDKIFEQNARNRISILETGEAGKTGTEKYTEALRENQEAIENLSAVRDDFVRRQQRLSEQIEEQDGLWVKTIGHLTGESDALKLLKDQLAEVTPHVNDLNAEILRLQQVKPLEIGADRTAEAIRQQRAMEEVEIEGQKKISDAQIAGHEQGANALAAENKITADQQETLLANAYRDELANETKRVNDLIALYRTEGSEKLSAIKSLEDGLLAAQIDTDNKLAALHEKTLETDKKQLNDQSTAQADYFKKVNEMSSENVARQISDSEKAATESARVASERANQEAAEQVKRGQFGAAAGTVSAQGAANVAAIQEEIDVEKLYQQSIADSNLEEEKKNSLIQASESRVTTLTNQMNVQLEQTREQLEKIKEANPWTKMIEDMQKSTTMTALMTGEVKNLTDGLNSGLDRAIQGWIEGGKKFGVSMREAFAGILVQEAEFVATWLAKKAEMWALDKILTAVGGESSAEASIIGNVREATSSAGAAAAAAYASAIEALPFPINVAVAPGVAAEALTTGLSFAGVASQQEGGFTLGQGLVMMHPEEITMPADVSAAFRSILEQGNSTGRTAGIGGSSSFTFAPKITALDSQAMGRVLAKNHKQFERAARKMIRNGAF